jgi:sugar phosphate permease
MQLPAGLLSDSWGPRNTITLFFVIAFIGSIVLGFAPSVFLAIVGRTLVGLGVAMLFVPTMKILAEWFHAGQFAIMTGILMALGGLGSLIAATPLVLLSNWIGWRMSFVSVGAFTLLLAILVWLIVRDRPSDMGWPSPAQTSASKAPPITLKEGVRKVLTTFAFWPIAIWFFFEMGVFFSYGGLWGGPYLMQVYGYSKAQSGHILSMLAIGMIVGSPLLSFISNNVVKSRKIVIVCCSAMVFCISGILAFFTTKIPLPAHYLICLGLGIFGSAVVVIGFTTNKELFPVQMAGTATGLVNLFPFAGGAVFQPILGYVLEAQGRVNDAFTIQGYQYAFMVLFACGTIALVASFFFKETLGRDA